MKRRARGQPKLTKDKCEICGYDRTAAINYHHIIPRCDPRCTNDNGNIAVVCHACHDLIHAGEITIIGVYFSTGGRKLMWFRSGEEPPFEKHFWKIQENPLVLRSRLKLKVSM